MTAAFFRGSGDGRARRIGRVWLAGVIVATAAAFALPQATSATATAPVDTDYVPTTTIGERSLDVSAFTPVCIGEAPFIEYNIKPIGFTSSGPATLTFIDRNGNVVETRTVSELSGRIIYPGASVDANGVPTDWPGWKQAENGEWIPDDSDAILRQGLNIRVEVNPTATAIVSYPPATAPCANPPGVTPPPTTTICVETGTTGGSTSSTGAEECYPCVPGQTTGGSGTTGGTVDPNCTLPRTGNDGVQKMLTAGAMALAAGIGVALIARRRKDESPV